MAEPRPTARAAARAAMIRDIKAIARAHLAEHGADGLSLRAVARELGVVSSAVYRYFPSRDDLLTALIVDAFDAVGAAAEQAVSEQGAGFPARWLLLCRAVRGWAVAHPHDYALVYGSPVPGYAAPADTVDPAQRVTLVALGVIADGVAAGEVAAGSAGRLPRSVRQDLSTIRDATGMDLPDDVLLRAIQAWTWLFGHLSYELFGHLHRGVSDYDAFFEVQAAAVGRLVAGTD